VLIRPRPANRKPPDLLLQGRLDPADLRLRGCFAGAGTSTIEPDDVDLTSELGGIRSRPILASAMDAVVDARLAGELAASVGWQYEPQGVQARYDDADVVLARIAAAPDGDVHDLSRRLRQPIRED